MSRQSFSYSIGRVFPTFFISFLLGGVWGFTAVTSLGIVALVSHFRDFSWHLLAGGTLMVSLFFVQRIAGWPSAGGGATETKSRRTDKIVSVGSFAAAYIFAWVALRILAVDLAVFL